MRQTIQKVRFNCDNKTLPAKFSNLRYRIQLLPPCSYHWAVICTYFGTPKLQFGLRTHFRYCLQLINDNHDSRSKFLTNAPPTLMFCTHICNLLSLELLFHNINIFTTSIHSFNCDISIQKHLIKYGCHI